MDPDCNDAQSELSKNFDEPMDSDVSSSTDFKKPTLLIGPKKGTHKFTKIKPLSSETDIKTDSAISEEKNKSSSFSMSPAETLKELATPLPYKEPSWGMIPNKDYFLEVLKSGSIVERHELKKAVFVFGRSTSVDCNMAHPTISRFHAVLQYGKGEDDPNAGFYLYDLNSTHGTFLNKSKLKPNIYVRIQVGHMIKLGLSTRMFILQGPPDDVEPESELSVTEMKNLKLKKQLLEKLGSQSDKNDDEGVDWGMGEDADEETDLSSNPFAAAPNEELYIDDPKKTLRGWFEREGCELQYDCQEKGFGQFVCRVELPIDDALGKNLIAEAIVKGKKKEAVVQCALEACRILDQHGLLRQATHESRKKKSKDWEADDYYDSDDDTFLDRTGTVERKRQKRMLEAGVAPTVHTYAGLKAEHTRLVEEGNKLLEAIAEASAPVNVMAESQDELDVYMAGLAAEGPGKAKISSLKMELSRIKQDEIRIRALANVARSVGTEELKCPWIDTEEAVQNAPKPKALPIIGKKRALLKKPEKKVTKIEFRPVKNNEDEEFDSD